MAKKIKTASARSVQWKLPFERQNFRIILLGLVVILVGYALMATGISDEAAVPDGKWNNPLAVYIAPVLLVIGYCVLIPIGIIKFFGKKEESAELR